MGHIAIETQRLPPGFRSLAPQTRALNLAEPAAGRSNVLVITLAPPPYLPTLWGGTLPRTYTSAHEPARSQHTGCEPLDRASRVQRGSPHRARRGAVRGHRLPPRHAVRG